MKIKIQVCKAMPRNRNDESSKVWQTRIETNEIINFTNYDLRDLKIIPYDCLNTFILHSSSLNQCEGFDQGFDPPHFT